MDDSVKQSKRHMKIRPFTALKAVRNVLNDPEQTSQVFRVLQALSGPSLSRNFNQFCSTEIGNRVLAEKLDLVTKLNDPDYLTSLSRELSSGDIPTIGSSIASKYLLVVLKKQVLKAIAEDGSSPVTASQESSNTDFDLFVRRTRASHDLFQCVNKVRARSSRRSMSARIYIWSNEEHRVFHSFCYRQHVVYTKVQVSLYLERFGVGVVMARKQDGFSLRIGKSC